MGNFEESTSRDESLIPNSQIETMFLRIANEDQIKIYIEHCEHGRQSLATAYASNLIYKLFFALVDLYEKSGKSVESLNGTVKNKIGKGVR